MGESWISIEVLSALDIREMFATSEASAKKTVDDRSRAKKRSDAEFIIEDTHRVAREHYKKLIGLDVGYTFSCIQRKGELAARRLLKIKHPEELKIYLRELKPIISRVAVPDADDLALAQAEIMKLRALLMAEAKCHEYINVYDNLSKYIPKRRGRKPRQENILPETPEKKTIISKIKVPEPDYLLMIMQHADVNPTILWLSEFKFYDHFELFRFSIKKKLGKLLTEPEQKEISRIVTKILNSPADQNNPIDRYVRSLIEKYF